ncbi:type II toxin-antitoxin system PemK/MazF family toxin [Nesterenkonia sp. CL21]|uniref:type II toxin-antitoxin system PemK/MazF family toxin n=1 Tax=Nesterenkonia sp. CL21 TaxID=3064894 RepID=UPI0028792E95|nr:type II toxin-antitoxin system PemK/MazF family toxin [Nesterenkonia sp. CL21]MDS2172726.1 type II toxin-antitoxin system PemK/MazF family toxin [Nesterenkonia sp. CL21]
MVRRGDIHWCHLPPPTSSAPAKRRPVLIIQDDSYNASRLATTIVVALTSNTALAAIPGNRFLPAALTGLPRDSVANVTALMTVDRRDLDAHPVGQVPAHLMDGVDEGLRQVLGLRA